MLMPGILLTSLPFDRVNVPHTQQGKRTELAYESFQE